MYEYDEWSVMVSNNLRRQIVQEKPQPLQQNKK